MSDPVDNPRADTEDAETVADLMGDGEIPTQKPAANKGPDLEFSAMAAAEEAIIKAELALAAAQVASGEVSPAPAAPTNDRSWILQVVLLLNIVLMGVMLALPNPTPKTTPNGADVEDPSSMDAGAGHDAGAHDGTADGASAGPSAVDAHDGADGMQLQAMRGEEWVAGIKAAGEGDMERAAHILEGYVERNPNMPTFEKKMYFQTLAHYLSEAGQQEKAEFYLGESMALINQSYLPADILRMAREAKDKREGGRMRQLLARFLLTQKKHTAAERRAVAEAYVELGDSYRIQAERGEVRAAATLRMREAKLRAETRDRRRQTTGDDR